MKTNTIEVCDAIFYDVSCKENDSVDIKCGGPVTLGYEFGVSSDENKEDMINHIKKCLKKYNRPFMGVSTSKVKNLSIKNLWTKDEFENCIKENGVW